MNKLLLTAGLAIMSLAASASTLDFTYNFEGAENSDYGFNKAETYDVAIRIDNPSFVGAKVTGIRVAVPEKNTGNVSAWMTSGLKLKEVDGKNVNDPDITSIAGEVVDGMLNVTFDTPYTIPAGGVYVGYSFDVTRLASKTLRPVSVVGGTEPDGLYIHSSSTKANWDSMVEEAGGRVSSMVVTLEGTFPERSAAFSFGEIIGSTTDPTKATMKIVNCGTTEITSIDYTGSVAGQTFSGSTTTAPIPGFIGASSVCKIEIPVVSDAGRHTLALKVTKINGFDVEAPEVTGTLKIYPFMPVNRPLVEEYTGLWCGWCPRGYVALETMKETIGDLFIAVAYHNGDPMAVIRNYPNSVPGLPYAFINRSAGVDPGEIYDGWYDYRDWVPAGDLDVTVEWTDESHTAIKATATARFPEDHTGADYRLSYILVADGLTNARWQQANYYSGHPSYKSQMPGELGDLFINGEDPVKGLTFNDVAVAVTDYKGEAGSIPAEITAGQEYSHSHEFSLAAVNLAVKGVPEKMRVVAVLTEGATGKYVNCNSSAWMNGEPFAPVSGVENVITDADAFEVARYTLDGRCISAPVPGVNIVRYSDGTVRKVMVARP